jgi:hypothetical protein
MLVSRGRAAGFRLTGRCRPTVENCDWRLQSEREGLVAPFRRGHRFVELKPAVWQAFDRFVAESMSGHDLLFKIAQRQMNRSGSA